MSNAELAALAEIIARWVAPAPGVPAVFLFGSRVRGDHRPDSDVDVRLYPEEWTYDESRATMRWWMEQQATEFAELQKQLPGRFDLGRYPMDWNRETDRVIAAARERAPVLVVRKVVCLWTPPKRSVTAAV
jgi:Polymerase beta, Nucleotidyltransferase